MPCMTAIAVLYMYARTLLHHHVLISHKVCSIFIQGIYLSVHKLNHTGFTLCDHPIYTSNANLHELYTSSRNLNCMNLMQYDFLIYHM